MEQSVAAAVREHCALAGGENEGAQRLEAGRSGQRLDPAFDPRVAQVHSHQEGEPLRMAQSRRFGVRSHGAEGAVSQTVAGLERPVLSCRLIFVEQQPLYTEGIHDRQRRLGAEHIGVYLRVNDIHGSLPGLQACPKADDCIGEVVRPEEGRYSPRTTGPSKTAATQPGNHQPLYLSRQRIHSRRGSRS